MHAEQTVLYIQIWMTHIPNDATAHFCIRLKLTGSDVCSILPVIFGGPNRRILMIAFIHMHAK